MGFPCTGGLPHGGARSAAARPRLPARQNTEPLTYLPGFGAAFNDHLTDSLKFDRSLGLEPASAVAACFVNGAEPARFRRS